MDDQDKRYKPSASLDLSALGELLSPGDPALARQAGIASLLRDKTPPAIARRARPSDLLDMALGGPEVLR